MDILYKFILLILFLWLVIDIGKAWSDTRISRKIIFGFSFGFLLTLLTGFCLAFFNQFKLIYLAIFLFAETLIISLFMNKKDKIQDKIQIKIEYPIILIILLGSFLLLLFPSTNIYGGRDEGLYFMEGVHIAQTGSLDFEQDKYMIENYEDISKWCELGYLGVYSKYYYGISDSYGDYEFQFMPLFPTALALGYLIGGFQLLIRVNSIIGILSLLIIYCFVNDFIGNKYHSLNSCILILLSPAFLWNARGTFSETLAQFIIFLAFYMLCKGWNNSKMFDWIISGFLIGITFLVRIDAFVCGIGFLIAMILMLFWDSKNKKYYTNTIKIYFVSTILCIIYVCMKSYCYIYDHKKLLMPLLMIQILLLMIYIFESHYLKNVGSMNNCLILNKKFQNCVIVVYWLFICIMIFIRPLIIGDSFSTRAVVEFSWYTSMISVAYLPIGIKAIINRNKERVISLLPFLCISGSIYLLYIYNPSISQDHIWCSRRWVFLSISFVMICFINSLGEFVGGLKKEYGVLIVLTVICYLLHHDSAFLTTAMFKGLEQQYSKLAEQLNDNEVYFTSNSRLATTLKFVYEKPVYYIDIFHYIKSGRTEDIIPELNEYLVNTKQQINYIGDISELGIIDLGYEVLYRQEMETIDLEIAVSKFPNQTYRLTIPANIYSLSAKLK